MIYATVAGVIGVILLLVKYMMGRARTDAILAEIKGISNQKQKEAFQKEAARLEQEIKDAKINYERIRTKLTQPKPPSTDT